MGAYLIMFPTSKIKMLALVFVVRIPAFIFLVFWIFQQVTFGQASLSTMAEESAGVAWWAHIVGFAFGVLAGFSYRFRFPVPSGPVATSTSNYRKTDLL